MENDNYTLGDPVAYEDFEMDFNMFEQTLKRLIWTRKLPEPIIDEADRLLQHMAFFENLVSDCYDAIQQPESDLEELDQDC